MTYSSIVILTGAGISAESGIATFRASDGLWEQHRIEDVATPEAFERDPVLVHNFYNARRNALLSPEIAPNQAHVALAELERGHEGNVLVVTQNIDDLHERAGSEALIHMHGEILKARCTQSESVFEWRDLADQNLSPDTPCLCCKPAAPVRPHIVWFGEMPFAMERIYTALTQADLFIAIGTSGHVYPAAGFVQAARESGAHTIEFNLAESEVSAAFDEHYVGPASQTVPAFVNTLLGG